MMVRGIRGATTVPKNGKAEIVAATQELLAEIQRANALNVEEVASVIFSVTKDLDAEFPATAARQLGWNHTPLFCTYEINVPEGLPRCIRVLLHVNTLKKQAEMKHVYLREAKVLRGGPSA